MQIKNAFFMRQTLIQNIRTQQKERRDFIRYESFETELDSYFNNLQRHWRKEKMRQGNSKTKGNRYELTISRILTKWYTGNNKEDMFWRTAGSGAKSTRTKKGTSSFVGDITLLTNPNSLRVWIDCKDRKDVSFNDLLLGKRPILLKWYENEEDKRDELKLFDLKILIIFKLYRKKENYVFFANEDFDFCLHIDKKILWNEFIIAGLDDFLKEVKKKEIVK